MSAFFISGCGGDVKFTQKLPEKFNDIRQYYGKDAKMISEQLTAKVNRGGNIIIEDSIAELVLQTQSGKVSYMSLEIKETSPCSLNESFDAVAILKYAGINANRLRLFSSSTHSKVYMDNNNKFKISVTCSQNGVPIYIGVSRKYYRPR